MPVRQSCKPEAAQGKDAAERPRTYLVDNQQVIHLPRHVSERFLDLGSQLTLRYGNRLSNAVACYDGGPVMAEGYCVKCKARKEIAEAIEETMKNGRRAIKGKCPTCGTVMFKILGGKIAAGTPVDPAQSAPGGTQRANQ